MLAFCGELLLRAAGAGMCIELHAWAAGQAQLERPVEFKAYVTAGGGGAHVRWSRVGPVCEGARQRGASVTDRGCGGILRRRLSSSQAHTEHGDETLNERRQTSDLIRQTKENCLVLCLESKTCTGERASDSRKRAGIEIRVRAHKKRARAAWEFLRSCYTP